MARIEQGGTPIKTTEEARHIKGHHAEKIFATLLLLAPNLEIIYEPTRFEHQNGGVVPDATVPDFRVTNLQTGIETFIEITRSFRNGNDPKKRQKRIMREAAPDTRYIVFYGEKLRALQDRRPEFNFF